MDKLAMRKRAFEVALKARQQEIDLYWTRANYFLTAFATLGGSAVIVAVLGAGFVKEWFIFPILYVIEWMGIVLAVAWIYANKGSKYWQVNWEKYVDVLGKDIIGPLFIYRAKEKGCDRRYSVSKINKIISRYILVIWVMALIATVILWCRSVSADSCRDAHHSWLIGLVVGATSMCAIYHITHAFGGQEDTGGDDDMIDKYLDEVKKLESQTISESDVAKDLCMTELNHYAPHKRRGCLLKILSL
ncbi:MAG: hypothetical protein SPI16_04440 [Porphyromonas sp.]|uniref:RipA family octameric membrane protein n=1 Tax=Porphyromonas sp. TaxID=1924944 RepID=UPI002A90D0D6|nr:hypothetical protein [Porphyromonas sp.]MDD7468837.1 hypothetical protein [Bacteroidales bacterium]MDY6102282.1 hypothetical protein [Porphyromonas sp.]